ncbi:hypothetical protein AAVH_09080 [Aphelenchoides avenae]|nr:hypothetical protein AAVH_09080 [Aphelenchus avenae]
MKPVNKPLPMAVGSPHLVLLDENELWQIGLHSGGLRKIGAGSMLEPASDFDLWYRKKPR